MLKATEANRPTHHTIKVIRRCNQLSEHYFRGKQSCFSLKQQWETVCAVVQQVITLISSLCQLEGTLISEIAL